MLLIDQASNLTFQLQGGATTSEVGNRIEVTGTLDHSASQKSGTPAIVQVTGITRLEAGVCTTAGLRPGGSPHGIAAVTSSKTGAAALIGGIGVAGTAAGLGVAKALSSSQPQAQADTSR